MIQQHNCAVILAAGEGKRMKWDRPKCLSPVLFKPMLQWVIDAARGAGIGDVCVVTGYRSGQVEEYLAGRDPGVETVLQTERKGTGHAVMTAAGFLRARAAGGNVLVLNGDAPFVDAETIRRAFRQHTENGNAVTVISAILDDPTGYGRIIRAGEGGFLRAIVEQKDASTGELAVKEVNSGAFWFRTDDLLETLPRLGSANAQGEYYLTDAVALLLRRGKRAGACPACGPDAARGAIAGGGDDDASVAAAEIIQTIAGADACQAQHGLDRVLLGRHEGHGEIVIRILGVVVDVEGVCEHGFGSCSGGKGHHDGSTAVFPLDGLHLKPAWP